MGAVSLEPGYETLPERVPGPCQLTKDNVTSSSDQVYSVVNKKQRAAPAARLPSNVSEESEKKRREVASENNSEEEGYETIPADKRKDSYDPDYESTSNPRDGEQSI